MMKHSIYLVLLALIFCGCQDVDYPEKPKNLIAKDKMVDILTETYLGNAARSIDNKSIIEQGIQLDAMLYKNFDIDSLQFAESNAYYANDKNTYMEIMQRVEVRLTHRQQQLDSIREMNLNRRSIQDSIKPESITEEPVKDSLL